MILPATSFNSAIHIYFNEGSPKTVATIHAPWRGGLLYIALATCLSYPFTLVANSGL